MKTIDFVNLFLIGLIDGIVASNLSGFAFEVILEKHLVGGLILFIIFIALLAFSSVASHFMGSADRWTKTRVIFMGISLASLFSLAFNIVWFAHKGPGLHGGVIETSTKPPYLKIMGIPFGTIVWSLFLASMFATLERVIRALEEVQKG